MEKLSHFPLPPSPTAKSSGIVCNDIKIRWYFLSQDSPVDMLKLERLTTRINCPISLSYLFLEDTSYFLIIFIPKLPK
jgi:hypothetical protein